MVHTGPWGTVSAAVHTDQGWSMGMEGVDMGLSRGADRPRGTGLPGMTDTGTVVLLMPLTVKLESSEAIVIC